MLIAARHIGVAGMQVQLGDRLVEHDLRQGIVRDVGFEIGEILQMGGLTRGSRREIGEIRHRLVVELEALRNPAGGRIRVTAGVPFPGDALGVEPVADMRHRLSRDQQVRVSIGGAVQEHRTAGVDHIAIGRNLTVL